MSDLVENILIGNHVEAGKLFESHMESILEKKLYEIKRSIAISEVVKPVKGKPGEYTGQNSPKDWAKYRKQHPSFGMYDVPGKKPGTIKRNKPPKHEKTASGGLTKHGIEVRRKAGYVPAHKAAASEPTRNADAMRPHKDDTQSLKAQAWRDLSKKRKGIAGDEKEAALKSAKDRLQKATDRLAGRSVKGILKGRNIIKNVGRLAKYGSQTSTAKSIKGGHDVWMGHKEPTTLKGKGIALVRDIFKG